MPKKLKYKHIIRTIFLFVSFFLPSFSLLHAQSEVDGLKKQTQDSVLIATPSVDSIGNKLLKDSINSKLFKDSISNKLSKDSISGKLPKDSIRNKSPKKSKDAIEAEVIYEAKDSIIFYAGGLAYLYGDAKVKYEKMELMSDNIRINLDSSTVQARGRIDSTGALVDAPLFKDGPDQYESKTMDYNFKTKKGFIRGVITQQGDGYITSDRSKKLEDDVFLMIDGKYTTCDNHEHPHFYLNLTKAKVKPKQFVVAGPAYLVIADVPLPLVLPFGYFPFTDKYSSGILMPSYGEESSRGFFLRNGGYYFALSDYYDLAIRADIYTKGSWGLNGTSKYRQRYKYSGNVFLSYMVTIRGDETLPGYSKSNDMKVTWTHSQDPKANPFSTFSASVNFASVKYNKNNIDSYYNPRVFGENNKSSSINYSYNFPESPFSVSANVTANQRQSDSTLALTLPNLRLDMSRLYPLKQTNRIGKERWFEKIYLTYNSSFSNSITTKQDQLFESSLIKDWNNGIRHQAGVGASYNLMKYLVVSPGVSYGERWYFKKIKRDWENNVVVNDTLYSFYRINNFDARIDFNTQLFGFYKPIPALGKKVDMIRHVFQPTVGFSWSPNFDGFEPVFSDISKDWKYFGTYYRPVPYSTDSTAINYGYFDGSAFGGPGRGSSGNVNFSVSNNVEMKITSKKDSTGFRKISLIDNLSASTSYNVFADSLNWSDISSSLRLKFTKSLSLMINAGFTPYVYQLNEFQNPVKVNVTEWERNGRLARMTNVRTAFGYSFSNDTFKKKPAKQNKKDEEIDEEKTEEKTEGKEPADFDEHGYAKFKMPWSFRFDYSISYADYTFDKEKMEFLKKMNQSLNFSGSVTFTKNWNFNFSSGYDFDAKKISYSSCGISRDLHCWTASLNLVPFGLYRSYYFLIRVKSSLLQDLKYDKQSDPLDKPAWY
jgi:hypothetical protein